MEQIETWEMCEANRRLSFTDEPGPIRVRPVKWGAYGMSEKEGLAPYAVGTRAEIEDYARYFNYVVLAAGETPTEQDFSAPQTSSTVKFMRRVKGADPERDTFRVAETMSSLRHEAELICTAGEGPYR